MKFYFCASARGHKRFGSYYKQICDLATKSGHTNLDDLAVTVDPNDFYDGDQDHRESHYERTIKNIRSSDIILLEVSTHSLSMGFIMEKALDSGKPVIALYHKGLMPYFAAGINEQKLQVVEYEEATLAKVIEDSFEYAGNQSDTRFNFFISPRQLSYLDWIARERRIPRSVFLRRLIESDMKNSKDFQAA